MNTLQKAGKASKFLLATAGSALFSPKPPKPPEQVNSTAELEEFLNKLIEMSRPPGLSLVVVKDGIMVYNKSFGLADGPNRIPANPETIYHWGSMTKPTTDRLWFLDNVRYWAVLAVVVLHVGMSQMYFPLASLSAC